MKFLQIYVFLYLASLIPIHQAQSCAQANANFKNQLIPPQAISALRIAFQNSSPPSKVLTPQDNESYFQFSSSWSIKCHKIKPYVVFVPATLEMAQLSIKVLYQYKQEFRIMSGGHDYECNSSSSKALINTRLLNTIDIQFQNQVAIIGAGVRWNEIYQLLNDSDYEIMGGQCSTVGVSGYTLGGGFKWVFGRYFGSAAENTLEATVVLYDGKVIKANWHNEYKDLMWALMGGGGGNYALVTSFKFRLNHTPQRKFTTFNIYYQFTDDNSNDKNKLHIRDIEKVMTAWMLEFNQVYKHDFSHGGDNVVLRKQLEKNQRGKYDYKLYLSGFCRGDKCDWERVVKNINQKFNIQTDPIINLMNAKSTFNEFGIISQVIPVVSEYPIKYYMSETSAMTGDLNRALIKQIIDFVLENDEKSRTQGEIGVYGVEGTLFYGSIKNKQRTSFPHTQAVWKFNAFFIWEDDKKTSMMKEVTRDWNIVMKRVGDHSGFYGTYINYIDFSVEEQWAEKYFGGNLEKLRQIKIKYDPEEIFKKKRGILGDYLME